MVELGEALIGGWAGSPVWGAAAAVFNSRGSGERSGHEKYAAAFPSALNGKSNNHTVRPELANPLSWRASGGLVEPHKDWGAEP